MEILHRGREDSERELTATCHSCRTTVRYSQREGRSLVDPTDGVTIVTVDCPVCQRPIHGYLTPPRRR